MLCSTKQLDGLTVAARDGDIGTVKHAFFDDDRWTIRHLVVRTGNWLSGRDVLVSPHAIGRIDPEHGQLLTQLTRTQVEQAPDIATDRPVSRQEEERYGAYYGYPPYWGGSGLWGASAYPLAYVPMAGMPVAPAGVQPASGTREQQRQGDPHLRSTAEVEGYHIVAKDGRIGHVEEFLFDAASWAIRWLVVDTRDWLPGRKVLVEPADIVAIDWSKREVRVDVTRDTVKGRPELRREELLAEGSTAT